MSTKTTTIISIALIVCASLVGLLATQGLFAAGFG